MGSTELASERMEAFATNTGLAGNAPDRRYLWTDAFAVGNFLTLEKRTGQGRYLELALRLVDRVHHVLGRHRADDARRGWISGLGEADGERHPTVGGLRIGKKLPERMPSEPFEERIEWERDGQYFHYLTRWMRALDLVAVRTGKPRYNLWARELADAAHRAFTWSPSSPGGHRMFWKMSIDLTRPLVASMGQHDPLDGLLTCLELEETAARLPGCRSGPHLRRHATDFAAMIHPDALATADPLGLGGLAMDTARLAQLLADGAGIDGLLNALLDALGHGLPCYERQDPLRHAASRRLAFRELGLVIGLHALRIVADEMEAGRLAFAGSASPAARMRATSAAYADLGGAIEAFWSDPAHREASSWLEHLDINEVMFATTLLPESVLAAHAHA